MGYYIFDRVRCGTPPLTGVPALLDDAQLVSLLEHGNAPERRAALQQLVERQAEALLVRCLASDDPDTAQLAIDGLWECWQSEKGLLARLEMNAGIAAMNEGNLSGATAIFHRLMAEFPDWAEAANKQATVFYLQGAPEQSIAFCRRTVELKPDHFGAWNGMALCAIQIEDWPLALEAVRQSLRLQPKSAYNRQLLLLVESRLPPA